MSLAIVLHILAAIIWVGGMFFAYIILRPILATQLELPMRLIIWTDVFKRFFPWVIACTIVLPISGFWMIFKLSGMALVGLHIHIMLLLGLIMILIFLHAYFSPFKKLQLYVAEKDWVAGGYTLNQIRQIIAINLILGLSVIIIASGGRFI